MENYPRPGDARRAQPTEETPAVPEPVQEETQKETADAAPVQEKGPVEYTENPVYTGNKGVPGQPVVETIDDPRPTPPAE